MQTGERREIVKENPFSSPQSREEKGLRCLLCEELGMYLAAEGEGNLLGGILSIDGG